MIDRFYIVVQYYREYMNLSFLKKEQERDKVMIFPDSCLVFERRQQWQKERSNGRRSVYKQIRIDI